MKKLESLRNKKFEMKKIKGGILSGGGSTDVYELTETSCGCPKMDRVFKDLYT